jgi:multidrug efflux pump subunit AcrA (membrane-fusion protein)
MKHTESSAGTQALSTEVQKFESPLAELRELTDALVVRDQESFVVARTIQKDWDSYIKTVGFELDPGIAKAKDTLDHLRAQKEKYVGPAKIYKEKARQKADAWAAEEKRLAAIEQERINAAARAEAERKAAEERRIAIAAAEAERKEREKWAEIDRKNRERDLEAQRKAGEINKREMEKQKKLAAEQAERDRQSAAAEMERQKQLAAEQEKRTAADVKEVKVLASVPTVAGVKNQTFFFGDVENGEKILNDYDAAVHAHDVPRQIFLRQFMMVNEQEVGKFARETKDNEKAAKLLPGVKFWSKG